MKRWALGVVLFAVATTVVVVPLAHRGTRSARPSSEPPRSASTGFDRRQSAALFVGVRQFTSDAVEEVPFAVDDAVDLAYVFSLERRVGLVPPRRVVLALSGRPVKKESGERLRQLREEGADVRFRAGTAEIRDALRQQAALAGRDGLLVVSIAAHGFLRDGNDYIVGASSLLHDPATMLPTTDVFEIIASSKAQRSVVFVDACRERMEKGRRAALASAASTAPLLRGFVHAHGQAVFYAAAAGGTAYDDFKARNGVFTKAVIGGLNCGAGKVRDVVTAEKLASYVERTVHSWIVENRDRNVGSATQWTVDGEARNMPLACCGCPILHGPTRAAPAGTTVQAFDEHNELLWQRDAGSTITHAEALDLDADGWREVLFSTHQTIGVLDEKGDRLWSASESMTLQSFAVGDLFRQKTNAVVALWSGPRSSRLVIYAADGSRLGTLDDARHFDAVAIGRPTNRHMQKIVATAGNVVLLFDPKKLSAGKPVWAGRTSGAIASLAIADGDGDGKNDIALTTESGATVYVDFDGHVVRGGRFQRLPVSRGGRSRR